MRQRPTLRNLTAFCALVLALSPVQAKAQSNRTIVFISDTHFGLGRNADGTWNAHEDARWPVALKGFLNHLSADYDDRVDLVVLGDFLELWQPYAGMTCTRPNPDTACTVDETLSLVKHVLAAHSAELALLDSFAARGSNTLSIVPGNHDAALARDTAWNLVAASFPKAGQRLKRSERGYWLSRSGKTRGEHGQQIGEDVNRFPAWPQVTVDVAGVPHLLSPWGEHFVQSLFNDVEKEYPIIDNIAPESLGAKYRLADRGAIKSARDTARFLSFNLFQTSRSQFGSVLSVDSDQEPKWDLAKAKTLGHELTKAAASKDDELFYMFEDPALAAEFNATLDEQVANMSDEQLQQLCDQAAMNQDPMCKSSLSATMESLLSSDHAKISAYLSKLEGTRPRNFVFGHTHELKLPQPITTSLGSTTATNTGAFQRVVDRAGFESRRQAKNLSASDALRGIKLEDLPACYTFVVVENEAQDAQIYRWAQSEYESVGRQVDVDDDACE